MQQIPVDKLLMVLSLSLTSPENYIQLNSQTANLSEHLRDGEESMLPKNCGIPEMRNLSNVIDTLINNQLKITERTKQIELGIQEITSQPSTSPTIALGCTNQKAGITNMKLPNWPVVFPVRCVSNRYGDNWLLVTHKIPNSPLFGKTSLQSYVNSVGDMSGEYFIGFKILRAITDNELHELLILESINSGGGGGDGKQLYDHYEAVAFDDNNRVKLLGLHRTNRGGDDMSNGLTTQAKTVNEKFGVNSDADITIYVRRTALNEVPQLKGV